ncbi:adhesion G protein-coupled receptor E1-like [Archocentrus centrarchus]|uniref:adhesion G protein-coupled receptor E1-like n=1 Tax=Archocentrus centrarchus TaxID=63155 RepID=UPI0011EA0A8D|nr:adhesion G protein-coupled receptor E1-like [Archocentrus centrarchus]
MGHSVPCPDGFSCNRKKTVFTDINECEDYNSCGDNTICKNTNGSYYCQCQDGFRSPTGEVNFTVGGCKDIQECSEITNICGPNAKCDNAIPYYLCICNDGFISTTGKKNFSRDENASCEDIDECQRENVCGHNASCINTQGSYYCVCNAGFELKSGRFIFSGNLEQCEALNCDVFKDMLEEKFPIVKQLKKLCLQLTESKNQNQSDQMSWKEEFLKTLLSAIDELLSSGVLNDKRKVSTFLDLVETALRLTAPFIKSPGENRTSTHTELEMVTHKGPIIPKGNTVLSTKHAKLDIQMEIAAGDPADYLGFSAVSLMSYSNLGNSTGDFSDGTKLQKNQSFKINSKVVTVTVSNRNTSHLTKPVKLTLRHLQQANHTSHVCVFWDSEEGGSWSDRGCSVMESNLEYTLCSCNHLGTFAIFTAFYEIEDKFELQLIIWVGLSLSLICLLFCILTFSMMHSIKSPRTTIHLHLCINLFIANLLFLAGISHMVNQDGCAVVTAILHFCYLVAFCWICLDSVQLFRMIVLVSNVNFKMLYMMAGGYGVPALIVAISVFANYQAYGTDRYCWLSVGFIWNFFGPACAVIIINIFFFFITVWKLAQKFSSVNPDLDDIHKIEAFTINAVAQLFVLGNVWIFGRVLFQQNRTAMSFLTIFGSLEGVTLFIVYCLFSSQVREEYKCILSRICAPWKKRDTKSCYSSSRKARHLQNLTVYHCLENMKGNSFEVDKNFACFRECQGYKSLIFEELDSDLGQKSNLLKSSASDFQT